MHKQNIVQFVSTVAGVTLLLAWAASRELAGAADVPQVLVSATPSKVAEEPPSESAEQRNTRMTWFRDARFGMFIHWGAYAVPAAGEWHMHTGRVPFKAYEGIAAAFNPVKFDAKAWVKVAKDAGMKYIVITAKHHDGFCMWNSALTDYNIVKWTGFKRDVIAELARECQKEGLKFGLYYSVRDWHHPDWTMHYAPMGKPGPYYRGWWGYAASPWTKGKVYDCGCGACKGNRPITVEDDPRPLAGADMNRYLDYMKGQLTELLTGYGPVAVMWFDAQDIMDPKLGRVNEMVATMRKLQPDVIISDRIGPDGTSFGDYGVHEESVPGTSIVRDWETCQTMNGTWGYRGDYGWNSARNLVITLVDTTSKGGNCLLNVGPDGTGVIPPGCVERLKQVGEWMAVNGESVRGCGIANLPVPAWGRITAKGDQLFFHVFNWPADGKLTVSKLGVPVKQARLLGDAEKKTLPVTQAGDETVITVPAKAPSEIDSVIALTVGKTKS